MVEEHTIVTTDSRLVLEYECEGFWHIEETRYADAVRQIAVIDWYCEGFDTATRILALLAANPSEVG